MTEPYQIAIVIPAYKPDFLTATLQSIADQELKVFRVYVGDDASPADLRGICKSFEKLFDLKYVRFDTNLGQHNLVAHWNRCVQLTSEPWVWLFSDDDLMEPGCILSLVKAINDEGETFDLFHFNVIKIDADDRVLRAEAEFPPLLTGLEFARARLRFELASYAPDYVFSRAAFERVGGFVDFPLAWCSDDATWIAMAGKRGIRTLDGPKVHWRFSGQNISSSTPEMASRKVESMLCFLIWLDEHCRSPVLDADLQFVAELMSNTPGWLYKKRTYLDVRFWPGLALKIAWRLRHMPNHGFFRDLFRTIQFDARGYWHDWLRH